MIALAAFDMAGTTIDDRGAVYRALERAVVETGVPVAEQDLQAWMGTEKRAAITALIELGGGDPGAPADKVDAAFERFQTILHELYAAEPPVAVAGVPEAIARLRASGIRVALTTGFSRDVATAILDRLGWRVADEGAVCTVDALVCGDEVAQGRPAPYMIHRAMEATGVLDVASVLVAGDTVVDVRAGVHSGAGITVGVLTGKLGADAFSGLPCTVLGSVAEIPDHLATRRAD
ncbi:phosphonatase-like hydrolase [Leucobacter sp. CSA1]|uniref:Phosphonatase-like hydrolase n=1 Tax=Leucobacter chromiisoli TaxID=2796471 RepID=A0A934UTY4_9MICO|nr:phosphonatase-like hydrolase [Leucobacter chromiisoli]MBK0417633.1 phosphonatase-like hydrolase [Leucobacter chromiisoli]